MSERVMWAVIAPRNFILGDLISADKDTVRGMASSMIFFPGTAKPPTGLLYRLRSKLFPITVSEEQHTREILSRHYLTWDELEKNGFRLAPVTVTWDEGKK